MTVGFNMKLLKLSYTESLNVVIINFDLILPSPCIYAITGQRTKFIIWISIVEVSRISMVKHFSDFLPENVLNLTSKITPA